ncbi:hypothetical protein C4565_10180 [Candidatus Parcubacteria bacterium]|jgi:hypothetical protein|nr:MAG: hypothetical protein C4565_10180 [Candidatus Parcubacteria bacterium]
MEKVKRLLLAFLMMFILSVQTNAFADGDGNIDNGGGDMGQGSSTNVWSPGNEGVRVTVIRSSDHSVVTIPIDITNKKPSASIYNFGKVSKVQYSNGKALSPVKGGYQSIKPKQTIPKIISTNGKTNLAAIKSYFTDEQVIRSIATLTGMNFDILTNGDYKLLLEPMAYYKFEGVMIATTATEAAMYDEKVNGLLRKRMVSLTHKNLPLAMFLEVSDLGYSAWGGSTTSPATNANIKSYLGLGIVRFKDAPTQAPVVSANDYEYRVNTDVITAVTVSGGQSDPDHPTRVSFSIEGTTYNVGNVFYPSGDSQLAWVKWRTPLEPKNMTIQVTVSGPGNTSKSTIHVKIIDLDKNTPPNPVADDRNDEFAFASVPTRQEMTRADWSVWRPWWQPNWIWISTGEDSGYWFDNGWWEFNLDQYYANFSSTMSIKCDSKNPTANGRTMKSGYGINESVTASITSNQSTAITHPQNAVAYFPEFQYKTYWRLLEKIQSGSTARFEYKRNPYSTYNNRTHFTPIWMPDGNYAVNTWVIDAWTPVGMLSMNLTDSLTIRGNLWNDWHIAPLKP